MKWFVMTICAALLAAPAAAQMRVVADIPFPFVAAGKTHAAGEWVLFRIDGSAVPVMQLARADGGDSTLAVGNVAYRYQTDKTGGQLIFNRYGNRYFLSEIWGAGTLGTRLPPSREEKALRVAGLSPERTVMFARLR